MEEMGPQLVIVTPVFNDWESFCHLLTAMDLAVSNWGVEVDVVAVDDGSFQPPMVDGTIAALENLRNVTIVSLACNIGHQRAIAVGLVHVCRSAQHDQCVVMDCDGEDRPEEVAALLRASAKQPDAIVTARRSRRLEDWRFRASYRLYKKLFWLFTGHEIDFGNFCLIPKAQLARIVHMTELWNHFAGTLIRSHAPLIRVNTVRGQRYAGRSTMKGVSLIIHGLSAIAVFSDVLFVRLMVFSLALSLLPIPLAVVVLYLRFFTNLAIPGWTTTVFGFVLMYILQVLSLSIVSVLTLLSSRSQFPFVPTSHALTFVKEIRCLRAPLSTPVTMLT
jgi:polyisoprenyl-phosphate glycosyltransferase